MIRFSAKSVFLAPMLGGILCTQTPGVAAQSSLTDCAAIEEAQARLSCYDSVSENAKSLPVLRIPRSTQPRSTTEITPTDSSSTSSAVQDQFGLELKQSKNTNRGPDVRNYRVVAAKHNDFTGWTIEFDKGGTWKQVGTDDYNIKVGEVYTVRRASFNSYFLSNSNNNRKIKITRTQ